MYVRKGMKFESKARPKPPMQRRTLVEACKEGRTWLAESVAEVYGASEERLNNKCDEHDNGKCR